METAKSQLVGVSDVLQGRIIPIEQAEQSTEETTPPEVSQDSSHQKDLTSVADEKTIAQTTKTPVNEEEIVLNYLKNKGKI